MGQNWLVCAAAYLSAGTEGFMTTGAAVRNALLRPPVLGSLVLFGVAGLRLGLDGGACGAGGGWRSEGYGCAATPLLLFIPVAFIALPIYGRLQAKVGGW